MHKECENLVFAIKLLIDGFVPEKQQANLDSFFYSGRSRTIRKKLETRNL